MTIGLAGEHFTVNGAGHTLRGPMVAIVLPDVPISPTRPTLPVGGAGKPLR
jgi:hypothetical protein